MFLSCSNADLVEQKVLDFRLIHNTKLEDTFLIKHRLKQWLHTGDVPFNIFNMMIGEKALLLRVITVFEIDLCQLIEPGLLASSFYYLFISEWTSGIFLLVSVQIG